MRIPLVIFLLCVVTLIDFCVSDKHTFGKRNETRDNIVHETVLIDSNNAKPKTYFIKFKYFGSYLQRVTHIEFDINSPSTGSIESTQGSAKDPFSNEFLNLNYPTTDFYAKVYINATVRCKATLKIYGRETFGSSIDIDFLNVKKSMTVIYAKDASSARKQFAQNSIGKRENGDKLIHFESRNVTNTSRFPSRFVEYVGDDYITYVGFSFNSPTAMVLLNTTFISDKELNAIVYDMNTEHFVANVSVYGLKRKPENRIGLIGLM